MSTETLDVTLRVQAKHADLWEAAKKLGSQAALARYLGVSPAVLGKWINLGVAPPIGTTSPNSPWRDQNYVDDMEKKLFEVTGKLLSELWPEQLRHNRAFWEAEKSCDFTQELDIEHLLADRTVDRLTLSSPEDDAIAGERKERIADVLKTLPFRESEILKLRFGLDGGRTHTLKEVGGIFGVAKERIRQLEAGGIRRLQQPRLAERLVDT